MQKGNRSLLLHPLFLSSLLILLLNDWWWKYAVHNWLTGKLSDAAGLIVLPVFCRIIFPELSKKIILAACTVFFLWWKSPLSQPLINYFNQAWHWPVQRMVDYTDLAALLFLPLAAIIEPAAIRLHKATADFLRWSLGLLTFFSLCSTSVHRNLFQAHPASDDIYFQEDFTLKRSAANTLQRLQQKGILFHLDSVVYYPVTNQENIYYKKQLQNDSGVRWQPVSQKPDSTLYVRWEGSTYYLIPEVKAGTKNFRNVRFTLSENKKATRTSVTIQMFQEEGLRGYVSWDKKRKRAYTETFASIFQ